MASFGSIALFHLAGITPEAFHPNDVGAARLPVAHTVGADEVRQLQASYATSEEIDVVVFSAPQLSLDELRELAAWCDGRKFAKPMIAVTSPQVKPDADRMGCTQRIQLHELASRQKVPLAVGFNTVNPILVQGAAFGGITMLAGFEESITAAVPNGATVEIDPHTKTLRILES